MIKIGVIADTHIPDRAKEIPAKIMEDFKNADMVIHAGDIVEEQVLVQLRSVCKQVYAVAGNMDSAKLQEQLKAKEVIKAGKYSIGLLHGAGHPNQMIKYISSQFKPGEVDVVVFGHSHIPFNEKIGKTIYFNPGSATDQIFSPYNSYGIIELDDKNISARIIKV
ncbi:MAG: metallophosphoesterase [Candidatus Omnitrophica bacterium]|jgi:hypothetical protein|nr:metallophosphoesterase [Candidatus Omnitrophota bacterium]